jgi:membrane fusion protein, heavy metal efflux system
MMRMPAGMKDPGSPDSRRRAPRVRRRLAALLFAALAAGSGACGGHKKEEAPAPFTTSQDAVTIMDGAKMPMRFTTAPSESSAPLPLPPVTARVSSVEVLTSPSVAPLAGRVVKVDVRLGDHVKEGDRLIEVQTADLPALQHEVRAAQLSIKTKQAIVDRLKLLVDARAASQNDLMVAQSELDEAKLTSQAAGEKLKSLSIKAAGETSYWVLAGRSGTVVQLDAAPGKQVGPDVDKPTATVANLSEVLVLSDVAQKDAAMLAVGQPAEIRLADGADVVARGTIETISEVVDPVRQTVPVRVHVKNEPRVLRPNAFVNVQFAPASTGSIVAVPSAAVVSDGARSVVFVEAQPGVFQRRRVEVGRQSKDKAEITEGLAVGERVVTSGALLLLNALNLQG